MKLIWTWLIKPLLFLMDAERAHYLTLNLFKFFCKLPTGRFIINNIFKPKRNHTGLECFGLHFKNPIGLAAGLDKNGKFINELALLGFSHIEIGTVTPKPQMGNPKPRLFRLPKDQALINRMGFNNDGAEALALRLNHCVKPKDFILGINIGKNKDTPLEKAADDYLTCFEILFNYADYFSINISSPNTPGLRGLQEKEPLQDLLRKIQSFNSSKPIPKPILLKIAPDLTDDQVMEIKAICIEHNLSGMILTNTLLDRSSLNTDYKIIEKMGAGGLSGLPLFNKSNHILKLVTENKSINTIGVGGIMNPKCAIDKLNSGADLIQIYSGFIFYGPTLVRDICNEI